MIISAFLLLAWSCRDSEALERKMSSAGESFARDGGAIAIGGAVVPQPEKSPPVRHPTDGSANVDSLDDYNSITGEARFLFDELGVFPFSGKLAVLRKQVAELALRLKAFPEPHRSALVERLAESCIAWFGNHSESAEYGAFQGIVEVLGIFRASSIGGEVLEDALLRELRGRELDLSEDPGVSNLSGEEVDFLLKFRVMRMAESAASDPASVLQRADEMSDEKTRVLFVGKCIELMSDVSRKEAVYILLRFPDAAGMDPKFWSMVFGTGIMEDPVGFSEIIADAPAGPHRDSAILQMIEKISAHDVESAKAWLDSIDDPAMRTKAGMLMKSPKSFEVFKSEQELEAVKKLMAEDPRTDR